MKTNKIIAGLFILLSIVTVYSCVYAKNWDFIEDSESVGNVETISKNVWATISVVIQIISVGLVVFAGIRYMISSADEKANIKKEMAYLALGAIIVFGATTIAQFVTDSFNELVQ